MIEIKRNEPCSFEFEMQITGDAVGEPEVFFDLKATPGLTLCFKAVHAGNGVYSVSLPVLERHVDAGTYPCEICVTIGDHFYVPLVEECTIKDAPKPVVNNLKMTSVVKSPVVSVAAIQQKPAAPSPAAPTITMQPKAVMPADLPPSEEEIEDEEVPVPNYEPPVVGQGTATIRYTPPVREEVEPAKPEAPPKSKEQVQDEEMVSMMLKKRTK